jgi:hypothetical protein
MVSRQISSARAWGFVKINSLAGVVGEGKGTRRPSDNEAFAGLLSLGLLFSFMPNLVDRSH